MNNLKRQRKQDEHDDRVQKRACSDQSLSNLNQHERAAQYHQVTAVSSMQARFVVPKRCIHKIVTACNLTQAACCACLDARPDGFEYMRYMDGRTWDSTDCRWEYYCLACQGNASLSSDFATRLIVAQSTGIVRMRRLVVIDDYVCPRSKKFLTQSGLAMGLAELTLPVPWT